MARLLAPPGTLPTARDSSVGPPLFAQPYRVLQVQVSVESVGRDTTPVAAAEGRGRRRPRVDRKQLLVARTETMGAAKAVLRDVRSQGDWRRTRTVSCSDTVYGSAARRASIAPQASRM